MLNEVQIEGIIAKEPWKYDRDLFFRVASYRDADMPAKPDITPGRDEPDYINVRVPGGATSLMTATRGDRVRVHGFLQSRDFKESLTEFLGKARKNGEAPDFEDADKIKIDRGILEVVALRVVRMEIPPRRSKSAGEPAIK
ncbi:MAG: single-stranded DNA-binding protein [Anaerolineae bacterium]|nr:single-stranded DNA-binding protein [Anaerolineae bacterium]